MTAAAGQPARSPIGGGRRAMLAKVHLAAKDMGLADDARRDILERVTGWRSSADCSDAQLDLVLAEFKRLGWSGPEPKPAGRASTPVALKARAMWISLWNLGVVRNGTEAGLEAFAKRQLGVDRLAWADQSQGYRLIEALKAMAERSGWPQDLSAVRPERQAWALKARLVQRQAELLGLRPFQLHDMTEQALDRLAKANGPPVRAKTAA